MALESGILVLVLLSAVLHASWNAFVKVGGDGLVTMAVIMFVPIPACAVALMFLPALLPDAWPYVMLSAAVHWVYFGVLISAYRYGDLSQVYPIARGTAPAVVALEAWIFEGEALTLLEIAGVLIVSAGIISLAWRRGRIIQAGEFKAIGFALLSALTVAIYLLVDGMGGRRSGEPLTYICWLFVLQGLPLVAFALWHRRGRIIVSVTPHLRRGLVGGMIGWVSYGIAIWAMSVAPIAHVVAVRETNVLFGAIIGAIVLKEPFGRQRIASAAVVACGAVLLNLGR